jgi:hypothetical protein
MLTCDRRLSTRIVVRAIASCAAALAFAGAAAAQSPSERDQMREVFLKRVDQYVALHRDLERLLPPETITSNLDELLAPRVALARELRRARAWAREGNIFTPGVAVYMRVLITETIRREGITELQDVIDPELAVHMTALVNADYPAGRSTPAIPCALLAALPPLPPELRYSFVERDLILWDLHAALIVDVVRNALPVSFENK